MSTINMTELLGLTEFDRPANGDCDDRLVQLCNLIAQGQHRLDIAIRDGGDEMEARIRVYLRRRVEIAIGTPSETLVGMAAKATMLRTSDDHKDLLAESLANDALRLYGEGHGKRFNAAETEREMREYRS
jgi:hypothetical protein